MYSVTFGTPRGTAGAGVAALRSGTLNGGDSGFVYQGNYTLNAGTVTASFHVFQHNPAATSVFGGLRDFRMQMEGKVSGDTFTLSGGIVGQPIHVLTISGRRIADLVS